MITIGLIGEGISDLIILEHFIEKVVGDNVMTTELQPKINPQNRNLQDTPGNFDQVFKYCKSESFGKALIANPSLYIVIQIDSDVFERGEVPPDCRFSFIDNVRRLSTLEIIERIQQVLIQKIGEELYEENKERILFAIAVNESECWLLPFYYTNNKALKETGCIKALNQELSKRYKYTIASKDPEYYRKACKVILKEKKFDKKYTKNASLELFVDRLKQIPFEEEDEEE